MLNKILLLFVVIPTLVMAKYCVQASSVGVIDKKYILEQINYKVLKHESNVRVEQTGNYYSLRVGNFNNRSKAKQSLNRISEKFPDAFIRKCGYRPKSIIYSLKDDNLPYKDMSKPKKSITYLPPNYEN